MNEQENFDLMKSDKNTSERLHFNSQSKSPYSRRYNFEERKQIRSSNWNYDRRRDSFSSDESEKGPKVVVINDLNPSDYEDDFTEFESLERPGHFDFVKRLVEKTGIRNIAFLHIPERSRRFLKDFVTTLIEERWRYTLSIFSASFLSCWILFAILWYLIAYAHGDLNFDQKTGKRIGDGDAPCIEGSRTFPGFLSFSVETQLSIGFGTKYPNKDCPEAIFLMVLQILIGMSLEGAMVGIVYTKMSRPSQRQSELKFSKTAVICMRNGKLCLVFRICDIKQQHIIKTKFCAYFLQQRISNEGEKMVKYQKNMKIENEGKIILIWPTTVCHIIDESSPIYDISAADLLRGNFEIIVTLSGRSKNMGKLMQTRSSYLPHEILWGHRFVNIIKYNWREECYITQDDHFNITEEIDTPLCSARRLDEVAYEMRYFLDEQKYNQRMNLENCSASTSNIRNLHVKFDEDNSDERENHSVEGLSFDDVGHPRKRTISKSCDDCCQISYHDTAV